MFTWFVLALVAIMVCKFNVTCMNHCVSIKVKVIQCLHIGMCVFIATV